MSIGRHSHEVNMKRSSFLCMSVILVGTGFTVALCQQPQSTPPHPRFRQPYVSGFVPPSPAAVEHDSLIHREEYRLLAEGKKQYKSGDYESAERTLLACLAAEPSVDQQPQPEAEQMLGRIYLRQGRYREAIPHLKACDSHIEDDSRGLDLTIAYAHLGDYEDARKSYSDHLFQTTNLSEGTLLPSDLPDPSSLRGLEARALLERGLFYFYHADRGPALADLLASEKLVPNDIVAADFSGEILIREGRPAEAATQLSKVVASPRGSIFSEARQKLQGAQWDVAHQKSRATMTH
jgi:tetratricopeptide (TPR) repeat protein